MEIAHEWSLQKKLFCDRYVIDFHGTKSAIHAGYKPKFAAVTATKLLKQPIVQEYLKKLMEKRTATLEATAEKVVKELAYLSFHDVGDYYHRKNGKMVLKELDELTKEQRAAVSEYDPAKKHIRFYNKDPALDKLAKHFKLYSDINEDTLKYNLLPELKLNGQTIIFNVGEPKPIKK